MKKPDKIINRILFGVDVVIFNSKNEVLMLNRDVKNEKFKTGWEFVKGGVKIDETYKQAANREIKEEAGITPIFIGEIPKLYKVDTRYRKKPHYDFVHKKALVFFSNENDIVIDHKEHKDFKWMKFDISLDLIWVENGKEILIEAKKIFDNWKAINETHRDKKE